MKKKKTNLKELVFYQHLKDFSVPEPVKELRFHEKRKWRFDYAWPDYKVAMEVEGGIYQYGRHNHPTGFIADMEKYNMAVVMGWRLIRILPQELDKIPTIQMIGSLIWEQGKTLTNG